MPQLTRTSKMPSGQCRERVLEVSAEYSPREVSKAHSFVDQVDRLFKPLHLLADERLVDRDVLSVLVTALVFERRSELLKRDLPKQLREHMGLYLKSKARDVTSKLPGLPVFGKSQPVEEFWSE